MNRRSFLRLGGLPLLAPALLHAQPRPRGKARACILLFQVGGPYQCETFDPKPNAPEEVRGLFKPLKTRVPGILLTEGVPLIAQQADKLALLRAVHHSLPRHNPALYCSLVGHE